MTAAGVRDEAMRACVRARDAWERAGCPGATQLSLFPHFTFRPPEHVRAERLDRPWRARA